MSELTLNLTQTLFAAAMGFALTASVLGWGCLAFLAILMVWALWRHAGRRSVRGAGGSRWIRRIGLIGALSLAGLGSWQVSACNTASLTAPVEAYDPLEILLPYQRAWVEDGSRFKIGVWSRQTGKSFSCACEAVRDAYANPGTLWVILSAGERQALEFMLKVEEWVRVYGLILEAEGCEELVEGTVYKAAEIRLPNGSRILALPANPSTARGYSANIILDEFAFHQDSRAIWNALYPTITNQLRGGPPKKLRIVSTPNGLSNKFSELWHGKKDDDGILIPDEYSRHRVDIYRAKEEGLPVDIDQLRRAMDDPDGWAQEFECQFIDGATVLLPYELIANCESDEATQDWDWSPSHNRGRHLFLGIDFGRVRNLTVFWTLERLLNRLVTREIVTMRGASTPDQMDEARPRLRIVKRACEDYTGGGIGLGDLMVKEFSQYDADADKFGKVELCVFTPGFKRPVYSQMKVAFEQLRLRIPRSREVRDDLHSLQRRVSLSGEVSYVAADTEDGHADRAAALALAIRAAGTGTDFTYSPVDLSAATGMNSRLVDAAGQPVSRSEERGIVE